MARRYCRPPLPPLKVASCQLLSASCRLLRLTFFSHGCVQRLSTAVGRLEAVQLLRLLGLLVLVLIGASRHWGWWERPWLIVGLSVLRAVLTSCGWPLLSSVMNDVVPKASRGRWNALSTVGVVGWSGSAAVGGWLIGAVGEDESRGFELLFYLTAGGQLLAWMLRCLAIPLFNRHLAHAATHAATAELTVDGPVGGSWHEMDGLAEEGGQDGASGEAKGEAAGVLLLPKRRLTVSERVVIYFG